MSSETINWEDKLRRLIKEARIPKSFIFRVMFNRILELERIVREADPDQEFNELGTINPAEYLYFDLNMYVRRDKFWVMLMDWNSYSRDQVQEFKIEYEQLLGKVT